MENMGSPKAKRNSHVLSKKQSEKRDPHLCKRSIRERKQEEKDKVQRSSQLMHTAFLLDSLTLM
jgi:hypothetical protein